MGYCLRSAALALVATVVTAGCVGASAGERPNRIVSLNACADQYLIALADKDQVAALTQFARDPSLSYYADAARVYPFSQGQAEAVFALQPDLVIVNPYRRADDLALLKGRVPILTLKPATSFDDVVAETHVVAAAIGQQSRGDALIHDMQARVAADGRRQINGVAAHYQRGGYLTGPGTLMDDLMSRAGLANLARRLNGGKIGRLSLEEIVYNRPDFLILTDDGAAGQDEGNLALAHPALARAVPPSRQLHIPEALAICGGPSYPAALERLQAEADRVRASTR